jgi:hypothetical protein
MHLAHYFDIVRHGFAFAFAWYNWITNVTASLVIFLVISLFWPKARAAYKKFFTEHMSSLHKKLDEHHEESLRLAEEHHVKHMELVKKNHSELLAATAPKQAVNRPVVAKKTAPAQRGVK